MLTILFCEGIVTDENGASIHTEYVSIDTWVILSFKSIDISGYVRLNGEFFAHYRFYAL